jgi:hypothetical protein
MGVSESTETLIDVESLLNPQEVVINGVARLLRADSRTVVTVFGEVFLSWEQGDKDTERLCVTLLRVRELARQRELVEAFGMERTTIHRLVKAWNEKGVRGIERKKRGPKGPSRAKGRVRAQIMALGRAGLSMRATAKRLGLNVDPVRRVYKEKSLGIYAPTTQLFAGDVTAERAADAEAGEAAEEGGIQEAEAEAKRVVEAQSAGAESATATQEQENELSQRGQVEAAPTEGTPEEIGDPQSVCGDVRRVEPSESLGEVEPAVQCPAPQTQRPAPTVGAGEGAPLRSEERALAAMGALEEAEVQFVSGPEVPHAGVLLAMALFSETRLFEVARSVYGRLRPAFYGLQHLLRVLCVMAMLRIKRVEHLTSVWPPALGRVLGLDRAPEVKTVRRKLREIAARGKTTQFVAAMAEGWGKEAPDALGFLLMDGHVRAYSGKRNIPKAYNSRRRLVAPGVTDYWVNDNDGLPLFVVTSPINASLRGMLPQLLEDAARHTGGKDFTVKFDRGGSDAKLFRQLRNDDYHFMTYRVKRYQEFPKSHFQKVQGQFRGREVEYELYDTTIELEGYGPMRCVAVLRADGRQTHILTTRENLTALEVAYEMFGRWRQENFFKYMSEQFALDALVSYQTQPDDGNRLITNPDRTVLEKQRKALRQDIRKLEAHLGRLETGGNLRGNPYAGKTKEELRQLLEQKRSDNTRLRDQVRSLPKRIALKEAAEKHRTVLLESEQKRFTDQVKMAAYRVETRLLRMLGPCYARAQEDGRALLRSMLQTAGDIDATDRCVTVHLRPLSAPRHTRAMAELCEKINQETRYFPGTRIQLRFVVNAPECCS